METKKTIQEYKPYNNLIKSFTQREEEIKKIEDPKEKSLAHLEFGIALDESFFQKKRAIFHFQQAFKTNPECVEALQRGRKIYWEMGKLSMVAQLLDIELRHTQDQSKRRDLLLEFGEVLFDIGEATKAASCYEEILKFSPQDLKATQRLRELEPERDINETFASLKQEAEKLVAKDPKTAAKILCQAVSLLYSKDKDNPEIEKGLRYAFGLDPYNPRTSYLLETFFKYKERKDEIKEIYKRLIDDTPEPEEKYKLLIHLGTFWFFRLEEPAWAIQLFEKAYELKPEVELAFNILREEYGSKQNRWDYILEICGRGFNQATAPEQRILFLVHAAEIAWKEMNDPERASLYFKKLKGLAPNIPPLLEYIDKIGDPGEPEEEEIKEEAPSETIPESLEEELPAELVPIIEELNALETEDPAKALEKWLEIQKEFPQVQRIPQEIKRIYRKLEKWNPLIEFLKKEKDKDISTEEKIKILTEIAEIYEENLKIDMMVININQEILRLDPQNMTAIENLINKYEKVRRWPDLIKTLQKKAQILEDPDERVECNLYIARFFLEKFSNQAEAIKAFKRVLEDKPDQKEAISFLKQMYEKRRDWQNLLSILKREAEIISEPDERLSLYIKMANLAMDKIKRPPICIELWEQVLNADPENSEAISALTKLYERVRNWEGLVRMLSYQVEELSESEKMRVYQKMGMIYGEKLRNPQEAATAWKKILEINPTERRAQEQLKRCYISLKAWSDLEAFYAEIGKWDEFIRVLEREADIAKEKETKIELLSLLARVWKEKKGRIERTARCYFKILELDPENLHAASSLIPICEDSEDYSNLVRVLEIQLGHIQDVETRLPLIQRIASLNQDKLQNLEEAFNWSFKAFGEAPDREEVRDELEKLAEMLSRWEEVISAYAEEIKKEEIPKESILLLKLRLGRILDQKMSRHEESILYYTEVLEAEPTNLEAINALEKLYQITSKYEDLLTLYEKKIELLEAPEMKREILYNKAILWQENLKDPKEAIAIYEKILEEKKDEKKALAALQRLYYDQERWNDLVLILNQEIELTQPEEPRFIELKLLLAQVSKEYLEDFETAISCFKVILEHSPEHEEAQKGLEDLLEKGISKYQIAQILEPIYTHKMEWEKLIKVKEIILAQTEEKGERIEILEKIAQIYEEQLELEKEAFSTLSRAFKEDYTYEPTRNNLERLAVNIEGWSELVQLYKEAAVKIEDPSLSFTFWFKVAEIYGDELNEFENAVEAYNEVLKKEADNIKAIEALEKLYTKNERWKELLDIYRRKSELTYDPQEKEGLYFQMAFLLEEMMNDLEGAISVYNEVLNLDAANMRALKSLEALYESQGMWQELAENLEKQLNLAEKEVEAKALKLKIASIRRTKMNEIDMAIELYRQVLEEDHQNQEAREALEEIIEIPEKELSVALILEPYYREFQDWKNTCRTLEIQISHSEDPERRIELLHQIAEFNEVAGDNPEEAFYTYARAFKEDPSQEETQRHLERLAKILNNWEEFVKVYKEEVEKIQDQELKSRIYMKMASTCETQIEDYDQAISYYQNVLKIDPLKLEAVNALEGLFQIKESYEELASIYLKKAEILEDIDERKDCLFKAGSIYEEILEKSEEAISVYLHILELDEEDLKAISKLEGLYLNLEKWKELLDIYQRKVELVDSIEEKKEIFYIIGGLYEKELKELENAVDTYQRVLDLDPDDITALEKLDTLYLTLENWHELLGILEREASLAGEPEQVITFRHRIGKVWEEHLDDISQAITVYQDILSVDPEHKPTIEALEGLIAEKKEPQMAASVLEPLYEELGEWEALIKIHEVQLELSDDPWKRIELLHQIANLYEQKLELPHKSFDTYARAFKEDPLHERTLSSLERLAEELKRWKDLVELYDAELKEMMEPEKIVEIGIRAANIYENELQQIDKAIERHKYVLEYDSGNRESIEALDRLYEETERWQDLAEILRGKIALTEIPEDSVEIQFRLGQLYEKKTNEIQKALECYREILSLNPDHQSTISALELLFAEGVEQTQIAEILEPLYQTGGEWSKLVTIYEVQLEHTEAREERVMQMHRISELYEQKLDGLGQAFKWMCQALIEDPQDEKSAEEAHRLAGMTDNWEDLIRTYKEIIPNVRDKEIQLACWKKIAHIYEDELGEIEGTESAYKEVRNIDNLDPDALAALDRIYSQTSKWEELTEVLEKRATITEEEKIEITYRLANVYEEQIEEINEAIKWYRRIIDDLDPYHRDSLKSLERIYYEREEWENLYNIYDRQLEITDEEMAQAELLTNMAMLASEALDNIPRSIELWQRVLEIKGEDREALAALVALYEKEENFRDLVDVLERQVNITDDVEEKIKILERLGEVWGEKLNSASDALESWQRVLELDAGNIRALKAMKEIYTKGEDWNELIETINRLIEVGFDIFEESEIKELYTQLGKIYTETMMQPQDAIDAWKKVLEIDNKDSLALSSLERLYTEEAEWENCVKILEQKSEIIEEPEKKIELFLQIASLWEDKIGEKEQGAKAYEQILELDPLHEKSYLTLEEIYRDTWQWEKLVRLYFNRLEHLKETPLRIEIMHKTAEVYEKELQNPENAFLTLQSAFLEDYTNETTLKEIERLAAKASKWNELLDISNQVLQKVKEEDVAIKLCLKMGAWYGDELGHPDYALEYYKRVLQLDAENIEALDAMANIYRRKRDWAALVQVLAREADVNPNVEKQKELYFQVAELLEERLENPSHAMVAYRQILAIDETHLPAIKALERLLEEAKNWRELIEILNQKAKVIGDPEEEVAIKRQIAELYEEKLEEFDVAISTYRDILTIDSENMAALKGLERLFVRLERWQDLLDVLEMQLNVVETDREKISLYSRMATMLEEEFLKADKAAECYEHIVEIDAQNDTALKNLERIYRQRKEWDNLVQTYQRHIQIVDKWEKVELYQHMGVIYWEELKDLEFAIESFTRILDIDRQHQEALAALSDLYEETKDWHHALDTMNRLVDIVPETQKKIELYYRMGRILVEHIHDRQGAIERFRMALDLEPGNIKSLKALREIFYTQEDWVNTVKILQQEEQYTENLRQKGALLAQMGKIFDEKIDDHTRAIECYEKALENDSENLEAAFPLIEEYMKKEEWEAAEPLLEMVIRKFPTKDIKELGKIQYKLGEVCAKLEKDDKALKAFKASYEADSTHLPTLKGIAEIYYKKRDWDKAFKFYQMILVHHREAQTEAEIVDIFHRLGNIKLQVAERRKALNMFDKALEINPHHKPTLEQVITLHERQGDWEQVIHYKKNMMAIVSEEEKLQLLLSIATIWQSKLRNVQKAIQTYLNARDLAPQNHVVLYKLLELYHTTKQWKKAVEIIQKIVEIEEEPIKIAKCHYTAGVIYRDEIKNAEEAVECFNKALDVSPDYLKAFESIDRILTQRKDWKSLERNYRRMIKRVQGKKEMKNVEINLWHFLGNIYRERLREYEPAIEAFSTASRLEPENIQRHEILAELYLSDSEKWKEAAREHLFLIQRDPYRIASYKTLRKIYFNSRQYDKAWCVCSALAFLNKADEEEKKFFLQYRPKGVIRAKGRLDSERWIKDLFHPDEDILIGKIFETITQAVRSFRVQSHKAFGLKKKERRDVFSDTLIFSRTFAYVAQVLSLPVPELYLKPDQPIGLQFAITDPPASVVGGNLLSGLSPQDLTFIVSKHLTYYRAEHYLRWIEQTIGGLKNLMLSAIKLVMPKFFIPPELSEVISTTVHQLRKAMYPSAIEQLAVVVKKFVESEAEVDLKKWVQAVDLTAQRAGLLLCNDLETAAKIVQTEPSTGIGALPPKEKIKELILFTISEEYSRLRSVLGLTVNIATKET